MQQRFIRGIRYIPTLPTVLSQILAQLNDERSSATDLERIITHDQALSSKVLAVANSAYYGFRHRILTVTRAVLALGYEEIRNICLGASLMGFLHPSTFRDQTAAELLWLHSLTVGEAARILAEKTGAVGLEPAFTAGLLHDLGKVVLAAFFPDDLDELRAFMNREALSFQEAERALDLEHSHIGKALADHWDLPPLLGEAMGYHHEPIGGLTHFNLVATVHAADFLAREMGLGHSGNPDPPKCLPHVLAKIGLDEDLRKECAKALNTRRLAVIGLWQTLVKT